MAWSTLKRNAVRRLYDAYRWLEQRADPSFNVPKGGYGPGELIEHGDTEAPVVALTFDDGPHPDQTPRLLDMLAEQGVVATFYLVGMRVREHPDVARRIVAEGHELGNHSWSHRFLTTQSARGIRREIVDTNEIIEEVTGTRPTSLRPPYGAVTTAMAGWIERDFGMRSVLWSVDAADWEDPSPETITTRIATASRNGSIVLAHDPLPNTVEAVPSIIDGLLGKGLRLITVSEVAEAL